MSATGAHQDSASGVGRQGQPRAARRRRWRCRCGRWFRWGVRYANGLAPAYHEVPRGEPGAAEGIVWQYRVYSAITVCRG
jgi:hypothetical protein